MQRNTRRRWSEIPRGSKGKGKVAKAIDKVRLAVLTAPPARGFSTRAMHRALARGTQHLIVRLTLRVQDRYTSKMFLRGDSVILVLKNPH